MNLHEVPRALNSRAKYRCIDCSLRFWWATRDHVLRWKKTINFIKSAIDSVIINMALISFAHDSLNVAV